MKLEQTLSQIKRLKCSTIIFFIILGLILIIVTVIDIFFATKTRADAKMFSKVEEYQVIVMIVLNSVVIIALTVVQTKFFKML